MRALLSLPNHAGAAEYLCDFEVTRTEHVEEVHLRSGAPLDPIGGEDSGGTYFLCGHGDDEQRPVLYADSEGNAWFIGLNLQWALELLLSPVYMGVHRGGNELDGDLDVLVAKAEAFAAEQWEDTLEVRARTGYTAQSRNDLDMDLVDYEYDWDDEDEEFGDDEDRPLSVAELSRILHTRLGLQRRTTADLIAHARECAAFTRANPDFALINSAEGNAYSM